MPWTQKFHWACHMLGFLEDIQSLQLGPKSPTILMETWQCFSSFYLSQTEWKLQAKFIMAAVPLSRKFNLLVLFLNSFSKRGLAVVGSNSNPKLGQHFMFKGLYRNSSSFMWIYLLWILTQMCKYYVSFI